MTIQTEKIPVTVYQSTDSNAPQLDRSANCVATILKACLVTGYGDKAPAGWTMPFEDNQTGVKILRPEVNAEQDYCMRLSNDTGREMTIQVYYQLPNAQQDELNQTQRLSQDLDSAISKMECETPFKYAVQNKTSSKWLLIAHSRGFWFLHETANRTTATQSATYLFCGDTAKNTLGDKAVYLKHTGGTWGIDDTDRFHITNENSLGAGIINGILLNVKQQITKEVLPTCFFNGRDNKSTNTLLSPLLLMTDNEIWALPAYLPSTMRQHNGELVQSIGRQFINYSTATQYQHNMFIPSDYWEL